MQIRVTFKFPNGNEVRYLERLPMPGGTLLSHGARWCVTEVEKDATGGYGVTLIERERRRDRRKVAQGRPLSAAGGGPSHLRSAVFRRRG